MTKGKVALPFRFDIADDEQQVPPLRSPGFPVELGGVDLFHAPLPYRKAHTLACPLQRGRKSGYAPVGMTPLLEQTKAGVEAVFSSAWTDPRPMIPPVYLRLAGGTMPFMRR
jgi:hypothetical protein